MRVLLRALNLASIVQATKKTSVFPRLQSHEIYKLRGLQDRSRALFFLLYARNQTRLILSLRARVSERRYWRYTGVEISVVRDKRKNQHKKEN